MYTVFLVIQILVTLALVALILIQRNDSDGLGSMGGGGGGGNAFMTGRGTANLLTRSTAILATIFMLNSLWLAIMSSSGNNSRSLADEIAADNAATTSVPLAEESLGAEELLQPEMPVTSTPEQIPVEEPEQSVPAEQNGENGTPVVPIP